MSVFEGFAELVFGFVYPAGTKAELVVRLLANYLKQYNYSTEEFRVSERLRSLDLGLSFEKLSSSDLMNALMTAGNRAREKADRNDILATLAVNHIADTRVEDEEGRPIARERVAHVVRSLKRPEEVALLRNIYRPGFFLIGIADDDDSQIAYLTKEMGLSEEEAHAILERDQRENDPHGQRTRDTFYLADVFIELRNERYKDQLDRFLELVFGHPFKTPSREEHAMFLAYASAARSAQLGRQVGAAIATPEGEVVAVGMNEVPCARGGPYWENDHDDRRDHIEKIDSNVEHKKRIVTSIAKQLEGKFEGRQIETISRGINESELKDITEYGRAVHGEMDAILCCSRLGISVRGKYLFVTTFPCHNCTRHIIAAGIRKVYYIEPYPKSRARELHSDAICFNEYDAEKSGKIPFLPFFGIGPRRYLDLFSLELSTGRSIDRKDGTGAPFVPPKAVRKPRVPMMPLNYLEREDKLLDEFKQKIESVQGKRNA